MKDGGYAGKIKNGGTQVVQAPKQTTDQKKGTVKKGGDLRADEAIAKHADWAEELKTRYTFTAENVMDILHTEVGHVFARVLEDAGVYKCTSEGREAFQRFINSVK